jgi:hypothetical protein
MLVTADNRFAITGNGTFNELIVVRVLAHGYDNTHSIYKLPMNCHQFNNWQYINRFEFRCKGFCNTVIFLKRENRDR